MIGVAHEAHFVGVKRLSFDHEKDGGWVLMMSEESHEDETDDEEPSEASENGD